MVGLMGPFGFGNLGDAAIQQAMIENIYARYPLAKIVGFSLNPEDTEIRHHIKTYPVGRIASFGWAGRSKAENTFERIHLYANRLRSGPNKFIAKAARLILSIPLEIYSIFEASHWLKGMKVFVISGGGQLDDYWGGAWHHPYTLFMWARLAKLRGIKFIMVSVGKGSLDSRLSRWFVLKALNLAHYRSYRDEETKEFVKEIGFENKDDPVYTDLAYSLMLKPEIIGSNSHNGSGNSYLGTVGIGPMAYYDPRTWPKKDIRIYQDYLAKLVQLSTWLLEQNFAIRLFPGEAVHDHLVIQDFLSLLEKSGVEFQPDQVIYEPVDTVDDLMSQLKLMDVVVASRFHGVLLSQLVYKPILALSYHSKVNVLMNETGQEEFCFPIDQFSVETVKEYFLKLWSKREQIQGQLKHYVQSYRSLLDEQYDLVFADL